MNNRPYVALLDRNHGSSRYLQRRLAEEGVHVETAWRVDAFKTKIESDEFNAAIIDVSRWEGLNRGLVDWLRRKRPLLPIAAIEGKRDDLRPEDAAQVDLTLTRPVKVKKVIDFITSARGSGRAAHPIVEGVDLAEYLQFVMLAKRSAVIEARPTGPESCLIFALNGKVVHAEYGELSGESALYKCLAVPNGGFFVRQWRRPAQITIKKPCEFLLIEAARRRNGNGAV